MNKILLKANGELRMGVFVLLTMLTGVIGTAFGFGIKWSGMATKADVETAKREVVEHVDKCDSAILVEMRQKDQDQLDRYIDLLNKVHNELMRLQAQKLDKR